MCRAKWPSDQVTFGKPTVEAWSTVLRNVEDVWTNFLVGEAQSFWLRNRFQLKSTAGARPWVFTSYPSAAWENSTKGGWRRQKNTGCLFSGWGCNMLIYSCSLADSCIGRTFHGRLLWAPGFWTFLDIWKAASTQLNAKSSRAAIRQSQAWMAAHACPEHFKASCIFHGVILMRWMSTGLQLRRWDIWSQLAIEFGKSTSIHIFVPDDLSHTHALIRKSGSVKIWFSECQMMSNHRMRRAPPIHPGQSAHGYVDPTYILLGLIPSSLLVTLQ